MPKDVKLEILKLVEASPVRKYVSLKVLGLNPARYFRWQKKYHLDNSLEDKRGNWSRKYARLEDVYREEIVRLRQAGQERNYVLGPERILGKLEEQGIFISHETIRQVLKREGLVKPRQKNLRHEYQRFEASCPNELWQMDIMYVFVHGFGYTYLISAMDDYSRKIMHCDLLAQATAGDVAEVLQEAMKINQVKPSSVLTDRGIQFYSGQGNQYGQFEKYLHEQEIKHILARTHHPQTLGKLERYHRNLREEKLNWFEFTDPLEAKRVINDYVKEYNHERKSRAINRVTPQDRYTGRDKLIVECRRKLRDRIKRRRSCRNLPEEKLNVMVAEWELLRRFKKLAARKEELVLV